MSATRYLLVVVLSLFCMAQSHNIPFNPQPSSCTPTTISTDFTSDTELADNWETPWDGTWNTTSTTDQVTEFNGDGEITHSTSITGADQWGYVKVVVIGHNNSELGLLLRSNTTDGKGYILAIRGSGGGKSVWIQYAGGVIQNVIQEDSGTFADGNFVGVRVKGTGINTDVKIFEFDAAPADYVSDAAWEALGSWVDTATFTDDPTEEGCTGVDTPDACCNGVDLADSPGACIGVSTVDFSIDTGDFAGLGFNDNGAGQVDGDDFKAGNICP